MYVAHALVVKLGFFSTSLAWNSYFNRPGDIIGLDVILTRIFQASYRRCSAWFASGLGARVRPGTHSATNQVDQQGQSNPFKAGQARKKTCSSWELQSLIGSLHPACCGSWLSLPSPHDRFTVLFSSS